MWTDGPPAVAYKANNGHTAVGLNAYLGIVAEPFTGDWGRVIVNAGRWLISGPCVTPTPTATPTATATGTPSATPTCTPGGGTPGPWTPAAPRAIDAYGAGAAGDGTNAYVGAGYSFSLSGYTDQFARFNPVANTWTPLVAVPSTGEEIEFVYSPLNNKVYAFGGIDNISIGTAYNLTRIYDIATGTWSTGAPMPLGRQQMGSGYWAGKIYLAGGYTDGFITTAQSMLHVYDVPLTPGTQPEPRCQRRWVDREERRSTANST